MNVDIADLIKSALLENHCDDSIINDIDGHSTISLDFDDYPSILISTIDDNIWIWSQLGEENRTVLQFKSREILELLMQDCYFIVSNQLQLFVNDGILILKGIVHPDYLTHGSKFMEVLDGFFLVQEKFIEILK